MADNSSSESDSNDTRVDVHEWHSELPFLGVKWVRRLRKTGVLDVTGNFFALNAAQEAGMSISNALVRTRHMFERMVMHLPASVSKKDFNFNRGRYVFAMASEDERLNGLVIAHLRRIVTLHTVRSDNNDDDDDASVVERTTLGLDIRYLQLRRFVPASRRGQRTVVGRPRYEMLEYELLVSDNEARFIGTSRQNRKRPEEFERNAVERINALLGLVDECAEQRLRSTRRDACTLLQRAINAGRAVASIGQVNNDLSLAREFGAPRTPSERVDDEHIDVETLVDVMQALSAVLTFLVQLVRLPSDDHVRQHMRVVLMRQNPDFWEVVLNLAEDDFGVRLSQLASTIELEHNISSMNATLERLEFSGARADHIEQRNKTGVRVDYRRLVTRTAEHQRRRAIEGYYLMTKRAVDQARLVHVRHEPTGYQLVTVDATGAEVYSPPRSPIVNLSAAYSLLHAERAVRASTFDVYVRRKPAWHPLIVRGSPMAYGVVGVRFGAPLVLRREVPLYMLRMPTDHSADTHPLYISAVSARGAQKGDADRVLPEVVRGVTSGQVLLIDMQRLIDAGNKRLFVACANHPYMGFSVVLRRPLPAAPAREPRSLSQVRRAALANTDYRHVIYTSRAHQIALMSIAPDGGIAPEQHAARQHFMIVSGRALFTLGDGKTFRLSANESLTIPANVRHSVRNVGGQSTLKLYTVYTPPQHSPHRVNHTQPPSEKFEVMLTAAREMASSATTTTTTTTLSAGHPEPIMSAYRVGEWSGILALFAHESAPFRFARLGSPAVLTAPIEAIATLPSVDVSSFLDAPLSLVPSPSRPHTRVEQALYAIARMFTHALPALPTMADDASQSRQWDDPVPPPRCLAHSFVLVDAAQHQIEALVLVTVRQVAVARNFPESMHAWRAPRISTTIIVRFLRVRVANTDAAREATHLRVDTLHNHVHAGTVAEWNFESDMPFASDGATRGDTYFALLDTLYRHYQEGSHLPHVRGMAYQGAISSIVDTVTGVQKSRAKVLLASYRMLVAEADEPSVRRFHRSVLMSVGAEVRTARQDSRPIVRRRFDVEQLSREDITGAAVAAQVRSTYLRAMMRMPLGTTSREWLEQVYDVFWRACIARRAQADIDEFLAERSESPPPGTLEESSLFDYDISESDDDNDVIATGAHPGARASVVFLVPHRCVVSERDDPGCDARTEQFATVMRDAAESAGITARILVSDKPRAQCDLNRADGCQHRSSLWRALLTMANTNYVVEVHSFPHAADFSVPENTRSVVLALHAPGSFERIVARETDSVITRGSSINAIGPAAAQRGLAHVLLEVRQDASAATISHIAAGIVRAIKAQ